MKLWPLPYSDRMSTAWILLVLSGLFAVAGAIAFGYVLLQAEMTQNNRMSLRDSLKPQKEYSHEERLSLLASLKTGNAEMLGETNERALQALQKDANSYDSAVTYEEKLNVLGSLNRN